MALIQCNANTNVIAQLGTTPDERGLTTDEFKAAFDEAAKNLKDWLNGTHLPELDTFILATNNFIEDATNGMNTLLDNDNTINTQATQDRGFYADFAQYYNSNVVQIANGDSAETTWSAGNYNNSFGTLSNDTTNFKTGDGAKKCTGTVQYAGIKAALNLDLTKFQDGSNSAVDDFITFQLYIYNKSTFGSGNIGVLFGNEAFPTVSNYFIYNIDLSTLATGWNYIKIKKSQFTVGAGSPTWATIRGVSIANFASPSGTFDFAIDNIQLVRKDPVDNTKPNPFQKCITGTWTRDFTINAGEWFVGKENGEIVCRELIGTNSSSIGLIGQIQYSNFIINYTSQVKSSGYDNGFSYYIDDSTRLGVNILSNVLYLDSKINWADNLLTIPLTVTQGDVLNYKLVRNGSNISLIVYKNGILITSYPLSISTTIGTTGKLVLNVNYSGGYLTTIKTISITATSHAAHSAIADNALNNAVLYNAGAFTADILPVGSYGIDTTNNRLYFKLPSGTLKYVALT